uniref:Uncharacterized protein n=1 Tax=Florenciella parvula TaxID=236787 RepID=A0A7S2CGY6_9STRA
MPPTPTPEFAAGTIFPTITHNRGAAMDDDQYYDDGEPYDEGDDDEEIDDTALAEAMALNQQLRAALEMQALQDTQKMQQQQMYEMQQRNPGMAKSQGQPPRKAMANRNRDEWAGQHGYVRRRVYWLLPPPRCPRPRPWLLWATRHEGHDYTTK